MFAFAVAGSKSARQRSAHVKRSAGPALQSASVLRRSVGNSRLQRWAANRTTVGPPHDVYEQEADRVAASIMQMPNAAAGTKTQGIGRSIQRITEGQGGGFNPGPGFPIRQSGGRPLAASTRRFMEPRFGVDFSSVRVHAGARAERSAAHIQALAYTIGNHITLGKETFEGDQRLMAHELTHVVQQGGVERRASCRIQRRWSPAVTECAAQPTDKWIERIVVQQETPQSTTIHWSDGTTDSDQCSSGKGHCCVDPANPDGVACTQAGSRVDGSNCTPITSRNGYRVENRDLDHNGVLWWTEFVPSRGIALHEYSPVDGTPLSHGCVRLNHDLAVKTFCGVRQNRTWVQVQGFARPICDHTNLQGAWLGDFRDGGRNLSDYDGDSDMQSAIREARRMINAAFGRTLTPEEIQGLTASSIPRCTRTVARPQGNSQSGTTEN